MQEHYGSYSSYVSLIGSRRMRWARHVANMGYKRNSFRVFVGKSGRSKPLENPRHRPSYNKGKGKAILLQAWKLPDFKTVGT